MPRDFFLFWACTFFPEKKFNAPFLFRGKICERREEAKRKIDAAAKNWGKNACYFKIFLLIVVLSVSSFEVHLIECKNLFWSVLLHIPRIYCWQKKINNRCHFPQKIHRCCYSEQETSSLIISFFAFADLAILHKTHKKTLKISKNAWAHKFPQMKAKKALPTSWWLSEKKPKDPASFPPQKNLLYLFSFNSARKKNNSHRKMVLESPPGVKILRSGLALGARPPQVRKKEKKNLLLLAKPTKSYLYTIDEATKRPQEVKLLPSDGQLAWPGGSSFLGRPGRPAGSGEGRGEGAGSGRVNHHEEAADFLVVQISW